MSILMQIIRMAVGTVALPRQNTALIIHLTFRYPTSPKTTFGYYRITAVKIRWSAE